MKHLLFSLLLVVIAVGMVSAQTVVSDAAELLITGVETGISIEAVPANITGVLPSTTYSVYSNDGTDAVIAPLLSAEEVDAPLGFVIACDPYADVLVSFILPTKLLGATTLMPINFTQVMRAEGLAMYNPNIPQLISAGEGTITLALLYNFTVPKVIDEGGWYGTVVAIASYQ